MVRPSTRDPLDRLPRSEKRAWRAAQRRAHREHEADQLTAMLGLTGQGVTGLTTPPEEALASRQSTPVEMVIDGRRIRAVRVHRRSLSKLHDAVTTIAAVPLTAVGRYGPYWVLTFRLATEQLVLLAEQLTLLPDWGGAGGRRAVPVGPLVGAGRGA
jgi:hypothetical protein